MNETTALAFGTVLGGLLGAVVTRSVEGAIIGGSLWLALTWALRPHPPWRGPHQ